MRQRKLEHPRRYTPTLPVECWCQRDIVDVPIAEIQALLTRTCGRPRCDKASTSTPRR